MPLLKENLEWYAGAGGGDGALLTRCLLAIETGDRDSLEAVLALARAEENHLVTVLALDGLARLSAEDGDDVRRARAGRGGGRPPPGRRPPARRRRPTRPRCMACEGHPTRCTGCRQRVVSARAHSDAMPSEGAHQADSADPSHHWHHDERNTPCQPHVVKES